MGRATGIGGFFFRAKDPAALSAWYQKHFGFPAGGPWRTEEGTTVFAPFKAASDYFPARSQFMINLRVEGFDAIIARLEAEGTPIKHIPGQGYGRFAHVEDPEGNPVEIWEPPGDQG